MHRLAVTPNRLNRFAALLFDNRWSRLSYAMHYPVPGDQPGDEEAEEEEEEEDTDVDEIPATEDHYD